jgi:hypothetical protein
MSNKKSTITPNKLQENTTVEEKKPSSAPKKAVNEIDEIFARKKRKKTDVKKTGKANEATKSTDKTKKKNDKKKPRRLDESEYVERPSRPRKKTEDGLTIYTEEELGISKGDAGSTPLCPFDCSCCF